MPLSPDSWHKRFTQQARWTQDLRAYLYEQAGIDRARRILDLGCGTGVLEAEIQLRSQAAIHGLDINPVHLDIANQHVPHVNFTLGDAHYLPYARETFDVSLCHFLLLWVTDPATVTSEMARVTRPGGTVMALAEPDYGGRIDYPSELEQIGEWQQIALRRQGAEPQIGRRLAAIFLAAGLESIQTGVLGGQWSRSISPEEQDSEWMVIRSDLAEWIPSERIEQLRQVDSAAWQRGDRILYVPTFFAWGRVPG